LAFLAFIYTLARRLPFRSVAGLSCPSRKQGTALLLSDLGTKFHDLLQLTKLLTVFSVYATEAEAINSFGVLAQTVSA
jgi:hypothetical protein